MRRFWWRGTQRRRLVVACLSMLLSLMGTSLALIGDGQAPPVPAFSALFPFTTTPQPVSPTVTVRSVSAVDQFEGVDTASGDLVRVRVVGIRSSAPCWQAESLAFGRDALLDKRVRLVVITTGRAADGRLPAQVQLREGQDFALTALTAGAALAGTAEVDPRLLAAETDARANRLGLWANACAPSQSRPSASESATSTTTTSPTPPPGDTTVSPPPSASIEPTTTTTTASKPADVQQGVKAGRQCSPEDAIGFTDSKRELICRRTLTGKLRWAAR